MYLPANVRLTDFSRTSAIVRRPTPSTTYYVGERRRIVIQINIHDDDHRL